MIRLISCYYDKREQFALPKGSCGIVWFTMELKRVKDFRMNENFSKVELTLVLLISDSDLMVNQNLGLQIILVSDMFFFLFSNDSLNAKALPQLIPTAPSGECKM